MSANTDCIDGKPNDEYYVWSSHRYDLLNYDAERPSCSTKLRVDLIKKELTIHDYEEYDKFQQKLEESSWDKFRQSLQKVRR